MPAPGSQRAIEENVRRQTDRIKLEAQKLEEKRRRNKEVRDWVTMISAVIAALAAVAAVLR